MPWLGQRKKWNGGRWNGHHFEEIRPNQLPPKPQSQPEPKLTIWGKVKRFFRNLIRKLLRRKR